MTSPRLVRAIPVLRLLAGALLVAAIAALLLPQPAGGAVSYLRVTGQSMEPNMHDGDLAVVRRARRYEVGDVVAFRIPDSQVGGGHVVIHRVTDVEPDGTLRTRGDNRDVADPWRPAPGDVVGRLWWAAPGAGDLLARLRAPLPLAAGAAALAVWVVLGAGGAAAPVRLRSGPGGGRRRPPPAPGPRCARPGS